MPRAVRTFARLAGLLLIAWSAGRGSIPAADTEPPIVTGPETEQRFPPLVLPEGLRATLFACDPLIEYPSVIAIGPRPGTLFVAHDYMTGLGVEIVRHDEVRMVVDTNQDGYADTSTLIADGFNSIQGLAAHAGDVYVMHAPRLTRLRDTDGDGDIDERQDLLVGLGLPPEETSDRLHCANGVVVGFDGWLYLALGDRGCVIKRPEGDTLRVEEGAVLRCRPDGTQLHVFSHGLRNIYDLALDADLNVLTRDNENDGGDYMIRVCHCFHGSDHGYPYLYRERPEEAMRPLADLGRGSSAGGTIYLESSFPAEYRDDLYFCEWGRAVVRYPLEPAGSSFQPVTEVDFAAGAANDPYGFKPTDLVVDWDGSLLVSDWGDGQRPKRGRGRIYRIQHVGAKPTDAAKYEPADLAKRTSDELLSALNAPGFNVRLAAHSELIRRGARGRRAVAEALDAKTLEIAGQKHAVWILAVGLEDAADNNAGQIVRRLSGIAETATDLGVRVQAIRALTDAADPLLGGKDRSALINANKIATQLTNLPDVENPRLLREVVIGLRRLHWPQSVAWLEAHLHTSEPVLDHAAMQLLRQAEDRAAVLSLLDTHSDGNADALHLRVLALQALAEEHNPLVVAGLLTRLKSDPDPARRSEYADLLCRACRRRAPWTYWGFRPAPRPANPVDWEQTAAITAAVNAALRDRDLSARATILARMLRENVTIETARLQQWLLEDHGPERVALLLDALERQPANESRAILEQIVLYTAHSAPNRLRALKSYLGQLSDADKSQLAGLAEHVEDGPVLAALLPSVDVDAFLLSRLESPSAEVRAVAVTVLAERSNRAVGERIPTLLDDADLSVICAAANAAAKLKTSACADRLLALADHSDPAICAAALRAMSAIGDSRAVEPALRALGRSATVVDALDCLGRFGGPAQLSPLLKATAGDPDVAMLSAAIRALSAWQSNQNPDVPTWSELEEQIARIQGRSGLPLRWRTMRPMVPSAAEDLVEQWRRLSNAGMEPAAFNGSQIAFAEGPDATVRVSGSTDAVQPVVAVSSIFAADPGDLELSIGSRHGLRLWWNGDLVFDHPETAADARPPERIKVRSRAGFNHVVVAASGAPELTWTLWLRSIGSKAEHERLTQLVLDSRGDTLRGSEVFRNIEQSLCLKCHRLNGTGAKIGPDLTGVGSRFSRIHLVESILTPSRSIAPSYEPVAVLLTDGQVMTGVRVSETSELLAIGDTKGVIHEIPHDQIDELQVQTQSIMPEGLEQRLTPQQLVDLVSFLESQKQATP